MAFRSLSVVLKQKKSALVGKGPSQNKDFFSTTKRMHAVKDGSSQQIRSRENSEVCLHGLDSGLFCYIAAHFQLAQRLFVLQTPDFLSTCFGCLKVLVQSLLEKPDYPWLVPACWAAFFWPCHLVPTQGKEESSVKYQVFLIFTSSCSLFTSNVRWTLTSDAAIWSLFHF